MLKLNTVESYVIETPDGSLDICAKMVIDDVEVPYTMTNTMVTGWQYTFGLWIRSETDGAIKIHDKSFATSDEWGRFVKTFTAESRNLQLYFTKPGTYYLYHSQLELGNKSTGWNPSPKDVEKGIEDASKTATNFIGYTDEDGLIIGYKIDDEWVDCRAQILAGEYNILDEEGDCIAKFKRNLIDLGMEDDSAQINLCGGAGYIKSYDEAIGTEWNRMLIHADHSLGFETTGTIGMDAEWISPDDPEIYTRASIRANASVPWNEGANIYNPLIDLSVTYHGDDMVWDNFIRMEYAQTIIYVGENGVSEIVLNGDGTINITGSVNIEGSLAVNGESVA